MKEGLLFATIAVVVMGVVFAIIHFFGLSIYPPR
jgi:hypothetical protein